ncbi:MAG: nucleotide exchange factor GrpE [Buchnera aphidicola (Nurudea yanoniella)]
MNSENTKLHSKKTVKENVINNPKMKDNEKYTNYKFSNIHELNKYINNIKKNIVDMKLREQAEIENIKKNTEKKIKQIQNTQLEFFCTHLIPILDNLKDIEKILCTLNIKNDKIIEGISLTLKLFLNTTKKFHLITEKRKNIKFDSSLHKTECEKNLNKTNDYYVSEIIKDGYIYKGKTIRKATVKIHKKPKFS